MDSDGYSTVYPDKRIYQTFARACTNDKAMKPSHLSLLFCSMCVVAFCGCSAPKTAAASPNADHWQPKTPITQEVALTTFDETWNTVEQSDVELDHGGVDWGAVKVELRPKAMNATSREELRAILQDMLSRLKRSHFGIIPAESAAALAKDNSPKQADTSTSSDVDTNVPTAASALEKFGNVASENEVPLEKLATTKPETKSKRAAEAEASFGLTLRFIEKMPTITGVRTNSPADKAGVQMGWIVKSVDGVDMGTEQSDATDGTAKYVQELILQSVDAGEIESQETWIFQSKPGELHTTELTRARSEGISTKLGLLPPFQVRCDERVLSKKELLALGLPDDFNIVVIGFNIWMPAIAQKVDGAFQRHLNADGMIIDLRGNPGGAGGMAMGVAGHVMDEPKSLGAMRTRDTTLEFKVNPRRSTPQGERVEPFSGPVAIIMDPLSASTSEIFAGGLQKLGRARVFGRTSAGAALPAQMKSLASGDALLFAFANFTLPDGSTIEGTGVLPDQPTGTHRENWIPNQDADVNAAAHWITEQYQPAQSDAVRLVK
jgi:carboxyl-terminal processing protease